MITSLVLPFLALMMLTLQTPAPASPVVGAEFIYERAPFPSAHASTIVESPDGLVAAWFGGTKERDPDVGIWVSRRGDSGWSAPVEVANGAQPDRTRHPCWNPVLFQPSRGPLVLFYKVGPSPSEWWGMVRTSADAGRTWSAPAKLPAGILGPIRAKPIDVAPGVLLAGSSTEHDGWVVHMERFTGAWTAESLSSPSSWEKTGPLNDAKEFGAIQPTILRHSASSLEILCRSRQGVITQAWSDDAGRTWGRMTATALPNPSAGIDSVRLSDGRFLLVYNPSATSRGKLEVALSTDGRAWSPVATLEDAAGEYSYPAMIQARDGSVHVTYTWKRERIKHATLDPAKFPPTSQTSSSNLGSDADGNPLRRATRTGHVSNYDESKVRSYTLPDPLVMSNGVPVGDAATWMKTRRPEIIRMYARDIWGRIPSKTPKVTWQVTETDAAAREGTAIRKRVLGTIGSGAGAPRMNGIVYTPAAARTPVPLILLVNFGGGTVPPPPNAPSGDPPVAAEIIARGWGYATVGYNDIQPDRADTFNQGVIGATLESGREKPAPDEWGTVGAW
jgi:predicted neuraminidase